jgi:hypothetical protein
VAAASIHPHPVPDSPDNVFQSVTITLIVAGRAIEPRKTLEETTMSFDGISRLVHNPHAPNPDDPSPSKEKQAQHRERICGFCEHLISKRQHSVLLKSGKSVHLHCYLQAPKRHGNRGRNSK